MTNYDEIELFRRLDTLRREHRTLEHKIQACHKQTPYDEFSMSRFKKEKLVLRDKISELESELYPDIIA